MRILQISNPKDLREIMQGIKVDDYGIKIMLPKAIHHLVRINSLSCIAANILKQEILSLGGDLAVARDTLTGKDKNTNCLLMGTLSQFNHLIGKLNRQPFGLDKLAHDLSSSLSNYQKNNFSMNLGRYKLNLKENRAYIMGIVNLTPDSFSGDGFYQSPVSGLRSPVNEIIEYAQKMVDDGADIIDVGGESTRPGAKPVSLKEELKRAIPIIKKIARKIKAPISIDTYKPETAKQALDNGAIIVNDITGLRNIKMAEVVSKYKAGVIIMHMQGEPATMQNSSAYNYLLDEIIDYLEDAISRAVSCGIDKERIMVDPGIGFGKNLEQNCEVLKSIKEFKILGRPLLAGVSRKSFIGKILKVEPKERIHGTISACILAIQNGVNILRVHDVREVKQALKVSEAITYGVRKTT